MLVEQILEKPKKEIKKASKEENDSEEDVMMKFEEE